MLLSKANKEVRKVFWTVFSCINNSELKKDNCHMSRTLVPIGIATFEIALHLFPQIQPNTTNQTGGCLTNYPAKATQVCLNLERGYVFQ